MRRSYSRFPWAKLLWLLLTRFQAWCCWSQSLEVAGLSPLWRQQLPESWYTRRIQVENLPGPWRPVLQRQLQQLQLLLFQKWIAGKTSAGSLDSSTTEDPSSRQKGKGKKIYNTVFRFLHYEKKINLIFKNYINIYTYMYAHTHKVIVLQVPHFDDEFLIYNLLRFWHNH